MSTRDISWGKGGRCLRLTTSPPSHAECHEMWELKPTGTLWATPGLLRESFNFTFYYSKYQPSSDSRMIPASTLRKWRQPQGALCYKGRSL